MVLNRGVFLKKRRKLDHDLKLIANNLASMADRFPVFGEVEFIHLDLWIAEMNVIEPL